MISSEKSYNNKVLGPYNYNRGCVYLRLFEKIKNLNLKKCQLKIKYVRL